MFELFACFEENSFFSEHTPDGQNMKYGESALFDNPSSDFTFSSNLDGLATAGDLFPFLEHSTENDDTPLFDPFELPKMNEMASAIADTFAFADFGNVLDDLWTFIEPFFTTMEPGSLNLVSAEQFTQDGQFDPINQCIVEGNVAGDISFIQVQTGGTCSLMAQEQFIARITGNHIPESELERIASEMGVYDPNLGTFPDGWNAILDYYDIPNTKYPVADTNMLDTATQRGDDVLIGVDARIFYDDPTVPPGSGHAVAIVGRGIDPGNGQLNGYYITDSNYPGQAHFKTVAELEQFWYSEMITVPTDIPA